MKILIISFGNSDNDGRLLELIKAFNHIGTVSLVSTSTGTKNLTISKHKIIKVNHNNYLTYSNYFKFILMSLKEAIMKKNYDILVVDNYLASIPGMIIAKLIKPSFLIQDVRELYFVSERKSVKEKIFVFFEKLLLKKADIVIGANKERVHIMKKEHKLKELPIVFENIRLLPKVKKDSEFLEKYQYLFSKGNFNLICSGGFYLSRLTDELVKSMKFIDKNINLIIIGGGTEVDRIALENIIKKENIKNVELLGKVSLEELNYVIKNCHVGVVNYHQKDLNNIYCASGKIYEFLGDGLPVVTTNNISLKEICERYGVGVSDDDFQKSITKVYNNYSAYKANVQIFKEHLSSDNNNLKLANEIKDILKKSYE